MLTLRLVALLVIAVCALPQAASKKGRKKGGDSLEAAGGKELQPPDVLVLGEDAVHAIANPLDRTSYAIHVYGGDLPAAPRRMWNPVTLKEEAFEYQTMMRYARELMGK